jgi:hypothetical protein
LSGAVIYKSKGRFIAVWKKISAFFKKFPASHSNQREDDDGDGDEALEGGYDGDIGGSCGEFGGDS